MLSYFSLLLSNRKVKMLRVFFAFVFFVPPALNSQNQYNIWYFGFTSAGLDFNGGPPAALTNGAMGFTEGCATYCNSVGQLKFYTNGEKIWDNTHTLMPNGNLTALIGGTPLSSMQSAVFIPVYGDTNTYYLFGNAGVPTGHATGIAFYTTIDATLNSGKGDVNAPLTTVATGTSERIVGVKHCNGMDHWVVTHMSGFNTFHAFRVTKCGVIDTVISSTGPSDTFGALSAPLKASPKGDKLSTVINGITCIYDFNNATGQVTGFTPIDTATGGNLTIANMFSPDGNLFYIASGASFPTPVYQFNLNAANINASKTLVGSNSGSLANFALAYDFQIGRDGKLYLSNSDLTGTLGTLDAINNPNTLGVGCGFTNNAVSLLGRSPWLNLPNHISDYLNPLPVRPLLAGFDWNSGCAGSATTFNDTSSVCAGNVKSWNWNFGDPSSGTANTSTQSSPSHIYNSAGTFTVSLIISDGCYIDTTSAEVTITAAAAIAITGDSTICMGNNSNLTASAGALSYAWFPSTGLSSTTGNSIIATPSSTTAYSVVATFPGGCTVSSLFTVNIDDPSVSVAGNTSVCSGDSTSISLSGASSYIWSPVTGLSSSTGANVVINPSASTTYSISAITAAGCPDTIPLTINVVTQPTAQSSGGTSICSGSTVQLSASGGTSVYWFPATGLSSTTGTNVVASPSTNTTYSIVVSNGGACADTTSLLVTVNNLPTINSSGNTNICVGASTTIVAGGALNYTWSPTAGLSSATGANITASPASTTTYTITGTDANGCTNTTSITINVLPVPVANAGPDKNICLGSATTLSGGGGTFYLWSNGTSSSAINVSPTTTTVYTLTVSNGSCTGTDAVTVLVNPLPSANAGNSVSITTGGSTTLSASGGGTYSWSPATGLSCSDCPNPIATPVASTIYFVTVTDANGCTATDSLIITVQDICFETLIIPNVFTPNSDGENEMFSIEGFDPCFESYYLTIYNRWGIVVFETNSPASTFWKGNTTSGELAPDGTYYYALITKNGPLTGFITLLR